jgi:hypothetical protein
MQLRLCGGVARPRWSVPEGAIEYVLAWSRQREEAPVVDLENRAVEVEDRDIVLDRAQCEVREGTSHRRQWLAIETLAQRTRIRVERRGKIGLGHVAPVRTSGELTHSPVRALPVAARSPPRAGEILVRLLGVK